jgi:peptide/nickel transport system substrate-binding protein
MRIRASAIVLLVLCLLLSLSPRGGAQTPQPRRGGTFVVSLDADPPSINPLINEVLQAMYPANQVYEPLVRYDEKFNPVPALAQSWQISPDNKQVRFNLVRNAKWHDGRPFTSADVKFTFEVFGPRYSAAYKPVFENLDGIDTPDANTVVFRFNKPNGILLSFLGDPTFLVMPKHLYEQGDGRTHPVNLRPVGTGPFKFQEWRRGEFISFTRNEEYHQAGLPYLDQVIFRVIPNAASQVAALERGELGMVMTRIAPVDARRFANSPVIKVVSPSVLARILAVWPNMRSRPLNSIRVRQALSLAMDRPRMVEQIALGQAGTSKAPIGSTSPYFDSSLPELKRDLASANKILDEAGFPRGADGTRFTLRLHHVSTVPDFVRTGQIVKENLEDIGVRVNIVSGEVTTTLDAIFRNWNFDLAIYTAPMGPEPGTRWSTWLSRDGLTRAYFSNSTGYENLRVDRLVREAVTKTDKTERTKIYHTIQKIIMADLPLIPLWEPRFLSGFRTEFEGAFTQPDDRFINFMRTWQRGR